MVLTLFCEAMPGQPPHHGMSVAAGKTGFIKTEWFNSLEVSDSQQGHGGEKWVTEIKWEPAGRSRTAETVPESTSRVPRCSLGLGVYGNGSKHDISSAASGTTPASNNSPPAQ